MTKKSLSEYAKSNGSRKRNAAFSSNRGESVHRWVPWIAGFSSEFVQSTFNEFLSTRRERSVILEPFAGVGTTLVEALRRGYDSVGFEINPWACLAAQTKIESASIKASRLRKEIGRFRAFMNHCLSLSNGHQPVSEPPETFQSRVEFFSPKVLRKVLYALDYIKSIGSREIQDIFKIALGSVMVSFSNYSYEPSLTTRRGVKRPDIEDAPVATVIENKLLDILHDIKSFQSDLEEFNPQPTAVVHERSFMEALGVLNALSVDLIVTSPPYLNNYHYNRNTRPHIHWLGMYREGLLKELEHENVGKFWQTVRNLPEVNLKFDLPEIVETIAHIREQNKERGVYGGNGWANYAASYFNDTLIVLQIFKRVLRRRGKAVVVIGNSVIQGVHVPVDEYLASIGSMIGLRVLDNVILREKRVGSSIIDSSVRRGTTKKTALYESAVILEKR
ncbi:site-specific DNA-methyltransferase [Acidobacteria bacterium AH-259-D05]|nr:site-specific DNA-methyltransferase [Acidobacteria bacterium AH-259-D05]